ncbi:hypothetical protein GCM10027413_26580 [Conyzicola nivalis]|uniref:Uncharacterized protein n=2 Tax=Conyzicola nivalis TaxID=1477021 RepID=A0A916SAX8_9MICO|nr:hypothetical protein GCM10010979_00030 [Conyzicola nivalis]
MNGGDGTAATTHESDALLSRLRVIEDQPLDARAEAYAHVHEQLQAELEGGDTHR